MLCRYRLEMQFTLYPQSLFQEWYLPVRMLVSKCQISGISRIFELIALRLWNHDSLLFRYQSIEEQFQLNPFRNRFHEMFCQSIEILKQQTSKVLRVDIKSSKYITTKARGVRTATVFVLAVFVFLLHECSTHRDSQNLLDSVFAIYYLHSWRGPSERCKKVTPSGIGHITRNNRVAITGVC